MSFDSEQKYIQSFFFSLQYADTPTDLSRGESWAPPWLRRLFFYVISGLYVGECLRTVSLNGRNAQLVQMRYKSENVAAFKLFF